MVIFAVELLLFIIEVNMGEVLGPTEVGIKFGFHIQ